MRTSLCGWTSAVTIVINYTARVIYDSVMNLTVCNVVTKKFFFICCILYQYDMR